MIDILGRFGVALRACNFSRAFSIIRAAFSARRTLSRSPPKYPTKSSGTVPKICLQEAANTPQRLNGLLNGLGLLVADRDN